MKPDGNDRRATSLKARAHHLRPEFIVLLLILALWPRASAQSPTTAPVANCAPLNAEHVVHNLVLMNRHRAQALHAYQGTRSYRLEYHGFPGTRSAEMVVKVKYLSPGTIEFTVQSATGSTLIIDKVFKKVLDAEREAQDAAMQRRSALTEDNYHFALIGYESGPSGATYMLKVEPRTKDKYLYRGRIWVDAEDFAVVRLEAEPARNPSFWTRKAEIVQVYMKVGSFWLPARNHSITAIRLGGHAELTIDYKDYEITDSSRVSSFSMVRPPARAEAARAQE